MDFTDPQTQILMGATALVGFITLIYLSFLRGPPAILPLDEFVPFRLIQKEILSHDTRKFTFALPNSKAVLGLPTGQHISLKCTHQGKAVQRSYTPVSDKNAVGTVSLVIKVYRPNEKFPQGGIMSQHLDDMKVGTDSILVKGPKGHLNYQNAQFSVKPLGKPQETRAAPHIAMIAGGTGITPMLQVLHQIFQENNNVTCKLLYANQTQDDILVRPELEALAKQYPDRFSLWYTLDRPPQNWKYSEGFINKDMIEQHLSFDTPNVQFFLCGPPPMIKFACLPSLKELGYNEKHWVIF